MVVDWREYIILNGNEGIVIISNGNEEIFSIKLGSRPEWTRALSNHGSRRDDDSNMRQTEMQVPFVSNSQDE